MPKISRWEQDPRETYGLMRAVPKRTLGDIAEGCGGIQALADLLAERGHGIKRTALSMWVHGTRRMSDQSVLDVAEALAISPLYVLDLAGYDAHAARLFAGGPLEYLRETGAALDPKPAHYSSGRYLLEELADVLANDYESDADAIAHDVRALALELMELVGRHDEAPQTCGELRTMVAGVRGDYRSIGALAARAVERYAYLPVPNAGEKMLNAVFGAGLRMKVL